MAFVAACTSPSIPPTPTPTLAPTPTQVPTAAPVPTPTPPRLADEQVLRLYCCATDPRSLRPQAASGSDELSIIDGMQRGLLYRDGDGNLVPSLANALPTVSADGLTYTYHLRDAQYSDGTPILAADFVRAARDLADPRNAFDYGYQMCYVVGAHEVLGRDFGCPFGETPWKDPEAGTFDDDTVDGLLDLLGVTAPDERTVVFHLYAPTSFWPDLTATWLLTPVAEGQTSWAEAGEIVSSGPFVLSAWTHNGEMVLTPNPHWYGIAPILQRIEINIGGDPSAAVEAWEAGGLDMVPVPSSEMFRVLGTTDYAPMTSRSNLLSVEYYDFATCQSEDIRLNAVACPENEAVTKGINGRSPAQNAHFRQALTQAIDKSDLIATAFGGLGIPAYSPAMPGIPGFPTITAEDTLLPFNPNVALVKLELALGELGVTPPDPADAPAATDDCDANCQHTRAWAKMLEPMRFFYGCDTGRDAQVMYLAEQWHELLGFDGDQLDVRCTDGGFFGDRWPVRTAFSDFARDSWGADFPHPDNPNRELFACDAWHNESGYCNPAYDALLEQGAHAASYADSLPFYHQAEHLLVEDAPVLFLRYGESISLVRPWVTNYVQTPSDHQNAGDTLYETIAIAEH
ncbi:MAG TPA: peptide ABC transporter substrate-binding protein [Candidatus Limnocylindria bacterium]|nr:peptide ABC transporter substrate-binding protein [Candidatus Limnocylindria bacterium]